ncbi:hypothetical protein EDC01DRAFT_305336 [Geopyxis carbonaria]|nr:hypothetical protein EDC01DRAFT_305336 [Geopyxis carbonaria]
MHSFSEDERRLISNDSSFSNLRQSLRAFEPKPRDANGLIPLILSCLSFTKYGSSKGLCESIEKLHSTWSDIIDIHPDIIDIPPEFWEFWELSDTLVEQILSDPDQVDDVAVWDAVYSLLAVVPDLVAALDRFFESQTRELVDPYIRAEIHGTVYKDVSGFHSYFSGVDSLQWECAVRCAESCSEDCQARWGWVDDVTQQLPPWPESATEHAAMQWFRTFNCCIATPGPVGLTRFYGSGGRPLTDSKWKRKCDIFLSHMLTNNDTEVQPANNHRFSWYDVLVPGLLKSNKKEDCTSNTIVELAGYAREVFRSQHGRRFVHAFTICGDLMRCWLFDRAGVSISKGFRIGKNEYTFKLFVRILLSYATMQVEQFGFDTNYSDKLGNVFLPTRRDPIPAFVSFKGQKFRLLKVLFFQRAIVSRATLCWLAVDEQTSEECVIKDSWRSKFRQPEGDLLVTARNKGAWGAVECRYHGDVILGDTTDEIASTVRKGFRYESAKQVSTSQKALEDEMPCLANSEMQRMSQLELQKSDECSSSTAKRKLPGYSLPDTKRPKQSNAEGVGTQSGSGDGDGDRVHARLVFYTVGENIAEFTSVRHLLEVFRDAIKCHQSLFEKANILHRDISINNIMISKAPSVDGPKGFLIDLDYAKMVDSETRSGAPHRTGTVEFMAIEVLSGKAIHSWRHDLESFFYVLIWTCIRNRMTPSVSPQLEEMLFQWSTNIARHVKRAIMGDDMTFEDEFLNHLSEPFLEIKGLLKGIRGDLFPRTLEGFFCGTPLDHKPLYKSIIGKLEKEIAS